MSDTNNSSIFATGAQTPAPETPATEQAAETQNENDTAETKSVDEMSPEERAAAEKKALRERAKLMGLSPSPNAGVDTLKAMIQAKLDGNEEPNPAPATEAKAPAQSATVAAPVAAAPVVNPLEQVNTGAPINKSIEQAAAMAQARGAYEGRELSKAERRQIAMADALKKVRVRITNMDPKKANLPGEIITVANRVVGTVRVFVPFGEATDDGWHIPNVIYEHLKERKYNQIRLIKDKRTGTNRTETREIREFALEVLPPLTQEELDRLAAAQSAAGSID